MKANSYTQRKHDILSGKIPVEALSSRALAEILKTAIAIGDQEIADMIEPVLAEKKEEVRQRRNRRQIEYYHSVVKPYKEAHPEAKSELMPAKVKSNEYTEYQKKIVRGEIPYDHRLAEFDQGSAYTTGNKTVGRAHCGGAERQKDRP